MWIYSELRVPAKSRHGLQISLRIIFALADFEGEMATSFNLDACAATGVRPSNGQYTDMTLDDRHCDVVRQLHDLPQTEDYIIQCAAALSK
jgi:hypothetical protein